jgi:hypothetical protein
MAVIPESAFASDAVELRPTDPLSSREFQLWRLCTWSGLVYVLGELVSWAGVARFVPPPQQDWSAERVAEFYRDHEIGIRLGMEGVLIFALFYALLSLALARVMERVEGQRGLVSRVQLIGGVITALITMGCAVCWLVASFRAGSRDPQDIQLLNDLGWMVFDMTVMATVFQFVAFGASCLMLDPRPTPLLPRWFGYFSFWVAFTFFSVFLMPSFTSGPFSWHGLITFYIALGAFFLWVAAVVPITLRAITTIEREHHG